MKVFYIVCMVLMIAMMQHTCLADEQTEIIYGDGWTKILYSDGRVEIQDGTLNYLRWDGVWRPWIELNISSGDWSYLKEENSTYYILVRGDDLFNIKKNIGTLQFGFDKISLNFSVTPIQLADRSVGPYEINGVSWWGIHIPVSVVSTTKQFNWDNRLPRVTNESGNTINQSNFKYRRINEKLYFIYSQDARNWGASSELITFDFKTWNVTGVGGDAWGGNVTLDNTIISNDNIILDYSLEDFTTYTEVDSGADITVTSTKVNVNSMEKNAVSYVRKSYGAGHFGDFEHKFAFNLSGGTSGGLFLVWAVSDNLNSTESWMAGNSTGMGVKIYRSSNRYVIYLRDFQTGNEDGFNLYDYNITHYVTVNRTGTSLTYKLYNDSARTDLYWDGSVVCGSRTYEYVYATASFNVAGSSTVNGYIENLKLQKEYVLSGNITRNYTAILGTGEELQTLKFNSSTSTVILNVDLYASTDNSTYTLIQANASTNTNYDVGGNGYEYVRWKLNTTDVSLTPVIYNISAEYGVAGAAPNIISWSNNKTNNNNLNITINTSEEVNFNATANQTITIWNWYKDDVDQSYNYDNITLNWSVAGSKTVKVNVTNSNGISNTITWNVTVVDSGFGPTPTPTPPPITSVSPAQYDELDLPLILYILMISLLYLLIAFRNGVAAVELSFIYLIFAFFFLLFQTVTMSVNYIYLTLFLLLFVISIAGITKQGAD